METFQDLRVNTKKEATWLKWDHIHPLVLQSLYENNFKSPTEVQSYVLSTFKHYNDFIIASQTGSGKTLSFGIPILSDIVFDKQGQKTEQKNQYLRSLIVAPTRELALQIEKHLNTINKHTKKLVTIISLVGGISKDKQVRLLSYKPDIIVCTPGRLWDLMEEDQNDYLQNMHKIEHFVLDEADRMIELGHFNELDNIIQRIFSRKIITHDKQILEQLLQKKEIGQNTVIKVQQKNDSEKQTKEDKQKQLINSQLKKTDKKLKKIQKDNEFEGEFDIDQDVLNQEIIEMDEADFKKQQKNKNKNYYTVQEINFEKQGGDLQEQDEEDYNDEDKEDLNEEELNEDEEEEDLNEDEEEEEEDDWDVNEGVHSSDVEEEEQNEEEEDISEQDLNEEEELNEEEDNEGQDQLDELMLQESGKQQKKNTKRKVFLVSATILNHFKGKQKFKITKEQIKKNKDKLKKENEKLSEQEKEKKEAFNLKIQALLQKIKFSGKPKIIDLTSKTLFPEQLKEYKSVIEEDDKILFLYHYIQQHIDQNFIVFCNSITYCKKVTHLLEILKQTPTMLHSEMQQRQRLKKLDQFKQGKCNILVCTDVAARGLDIPKVQNVVHYQVPMDIDTYVHRSGRTARIGQDGTSYVLIGPKDAKRYNQLCKQLGKEQGLEGMELTVKERNDIRSLIQSAIEYEKQQYQLVKKQQEAVWYKKISKQSEIELDDELIDEMNEVEDEIRKKRIITNEYKDKHQKVVKNVKNIQKSRRNALFLDPNQIHEYAQKIKSMKNSVQAQKQQNTYDKNKLLSKKMGKEDKFKQQTINKNPSKSNNRFNKKQQKAMSKHNKYKKVFNQMDVE